MEMRTCVNCESTYPLTEEFWHKRVDDTVESGYRFHIRCRDCHKVYMMAMKRKQRQRDKEQGIKREFE